MATVAPAKSVTIRSSEVGFVEILADAASAGIPAFGGIEITSDSTDGASATVGLVGWIVLIVAVLTGRGDRVKDWMTGAIRSFGRPTASAADLDGLSDS